MKGVTLFWFSLFFDFRFSFTVRCGLIVQVVCRCLCCSCVCWIISCFFDCSDVPCLTFDVHLPWLCVGGGFRRRNLWSSHAEFDATPSFAFDATSAHHGFEESKAGHCYRRIRHAAAGILSTRWQLTLLNRICLRFLLVSSSAVRFFSLFPVGCYFAQALSDMQQEQKHAIKQESAIKKAYQDLVNSISILDSMQISVENHMVTFFCVH